MEAVICTTPVIGRRGLRIEPEVVFKDCENQKLTIIACAKTQTGCQLGEIKQTHTPTDDLEIRFVSAKIPHRWLSKKQQYSLYKKQFEISWQMKVLDENNQVLDSFEFYPQRRFPEQRSHEN